MTSRSTEPGSGAGLIVLLAVVFLSLVGFGSVTPLLPFYGVVFDAPAWQVTLLFSGYSLGQFVGELTWGRLSDRVGRRSVLLGTTVCNGLAFCVLAFAPNLWVAIAARMVSGVFSGNFSTVQGYIADITTPAERAERLGLLSAVGGVGFVVGPAMGGLLARPELGELGMRIPLLAAAAMYGAAAIGGLLFLADTRRVASGQSRPAQRAGAREVLRDPVVIRLLGMTFVSYCAFSAVMPTLGLWSQDRFGWAPREVGLLLAAAGGAGAIVQFLTGQLVARRGVREITVISISLILMSVFLVWLAYSGSPVLAVMLATSAVAAHMASQPATVGLISRSTPPDHQGAVLGANMAVAALARVSGPVTAGFLISSFDTATPFLGAAAILLPAIALAFSAARAGRRQKSQASSNRPMP